MWFCAAPLLPACPLSAVLVSTLPDLNVFIYLYCNYYLTSNWSHLHRSRHSWGVTEGVIKPWSIPAHQSFMSALLSWHCLGSLNCYTLLERQIISAYVLLVSFGTYRLGFISWCAHALTFSASHHLSPLLTDPDFLSPLPCSFIFPWLP